MTEDPQVVIRDGQWLGIGEVYADYGTEEWLVRLDGEVVEHPLLTEFPDDGTGTTVRSPREAVYLASAAATRSKARNSIDDEGRIHVMVEDLVQADAA